MTDPTRSEHEHMEHGWPILRRTLCRVGEHMFVWTGNEYSPEPHPDMRCDCGAVRWADHKAAV